MGVFLFYILKSAVCLIVFFLLFKVLLSRDTFFGFNRGILLGGMLACCLLPAMRLEVSGEAGVICGKIKGLEEMLTREYIVGQEDHGQEMPLSLSDLNGVQEGIAAQNTVLEGHVSLRAGAEKKEVIFPVGLILLFIYCLGALGVSIGLGLSFVRMGKLLRSGSRQKYGAYILVLTHEKVCPFSWGRYIVMNENDYRSAPHEILVHEKVHADQRHTWDLGFVELLLILQWFNPSIWLIKKELQKIHEYEADKGVINQGIDATQYQLFLVKKAVGARLYSIANSFGHSKLKNRITMMLKEKSNRWARLKVMLLIPPAALLMLAFARPGDKLPAISGDFKITENSANNKMEPEENIHPDTLIQRLQNYFIREFENKLNEEAKARYKKSGKFTRSEPVEIQFLLMNQKGNILFGERVSDINELSVVLANWKNKNLKSEPVYLYLQKDKATPSGDWLKLLQIVKEFYEGEKDNSQFPLKVMIVKPRPQNIEIIAISADKSRNHVFAPNLNELEKCLNTNDYGKYERVEVIFEYSFPDREKGMDLVKRIVAGKGWDHVKVTSAPPPPPPLPDYYIQVQSKDAEGKAYQVNVYGNNCAQLERQLMDHKNVYPGGKVVLKLHKSLNRTAVDSVRNMLKNHRFEVVPDME